MIKIIHTFIESNQVVPGSNNHVYLINIKLPEDYPSSIPGQFINVYLNNNSKLLPRPISIYDHTDNAIKLLYAVVGGGSKELANYEAGSQIRISTPLGNGFSLPDEKGESLILMGGGMGIAPLHYFNKFMFEHYEDEISKYENIKLILGFKDTPFLTEEFAVSNGAQNHETIICSESSSEVANDYVLGNVITPCKNMSSDNNHILCCGPTPMMKAVNEHFSGGDSNIVQVSLEERMGCGFGVCVGCTVKLKSNEDNDIIQKKVCKDGPVFKGNGVIWND